MSYNFFFFFFSMSYIGRLSLMRNSLPETIHEHSHMVAVIAHALGKIRRDVFHGDGEPDECAAAALYHERSEILTGDLPTPIKYYSRQIQSAYKQVEALANEKLLNTLPPELRASFEDVMTGDKQSRTHDIVKAADKLSAYIKCIEERRAGNDDFISAEKSTLAALKSYAMPEVDYFIEHFIPAFELTLDELGTGIEEGEGT